MRYYNCLIRNWKTDIKKQSDSLVINRMWKRSEEFIRKVNVNFNNCQLKKMYLLRRNY